MYGGLRRAEICEIKWDKVDMETCRIIVAGQIVRVGTRPPCFTEILKTESSYCVVQLPRFVIDELVALIYY